jgi:hypothetical protein
MPEIRSYRSPKRRSSKIRRRKRKGEREREIGESVDFVREAPGAVCTGGGICVVLWQCFFF